METTINKESIKEFYRKMFEACSKMEVQMLTRSVEEPNQGQHWIKQADHWGMRSTYWLHKLVS